MDWAHGIQVVNATILHRKKRIKTLVRSDLVKNGPSASKSIGSASDRATTEIYSKKNMFAQVVDMVAQKLASCRPW